MATRLSLERVRGRPFRTMRFERLRGRAAMRRARDGCDRPMAGAFAIARVQGLVIFPDAAEQSSGASTGNSTPATPPAWSCFRPVDAKPHGGVPRTYRPTLRLGILNTGIQNTRCQAHRGGSDSCQQSNGLRVLNRRYLESVIRYRLPARARLAYQATASRQRCVPARGRASPRQGLR